MGRAKLVDYPATFAPSDPPREGRMVFWRSTALLGPADDLIVPAGARRGEKEITVLRAQAGGPRTARVPYWWMPATDAVPVLARAYRDGEGEDACRYWGAASLFALHLLSLGRMKPTLTPSGFDAWKACPRDADEHAHFDELATAMPPHAHAIPPHGHNLFHGHAMSLPAAPYLLSGFLDAVADSMLRTPGAPFLTGSAPFTARAPQHVPHLLMSSAPTPAEPPVRVRISLRVHIEDIDDNDVLAVVQVHDLDGPQELADADALWDKPAPPGSADAARRTGTLIALRQAARAWEPLARLLGADVPGALVLDDTEVDQLLGDAAAQLDEVGCEVHWPRDLVRSLTVRAVLKPRSDQRASGLLGPDQLMSFSWQAAFDGDGDLTEGEMDRLAEARRPFIRLRDRWVRVDAALIRKARRRRIAELSGIDALGAALTGSLDIGGQSVLVESGGELEALRHALTHPAPRAKVPDQLTGTLRNYQHEALSWMLHLTGHGLGACLADDMGLGKTVTTIAFHQARQNSPATRGPTLVICPATLLGNWDQEIRRFAPGVSVRRFHGPHRDRALDHLGDNAIVLTTYGTARRSTKDLAAAPSWSAVVLDEAQNVKNAASATAQALRAIPSHARVALTGTPVENNLAELWAILDWATPGLLGSPSAFKTRFRTPIESRQDPTAAAQLAALISPFVLRRRKSDPGIAPELPPKTETVEYTSLTREQVVLYEAAVRESMQQIEAAEGIARRGLVLKLLTALRQICNHPAQYLKERSPDRIAGRSGKFDLLDDLLTILLAEKKSVLVFTQYVQTARLLTSHFDRQGIDYRFLHGATPVHQREEFVAGFQQGDFRVFLLSLRAAGTGLNLTRAEHVAFLDLWWNPAVMDQAADRAHRIGTEHPVQIHYLVSEGTLEEKILQLLTEKKELAESVLSHTKGTLSELSDKQLADLVALRSPR